MTLRPRSIVLMLLTGALSWQAPQAAAEVRRCVTPSGQAIFTDRICADIGATERVPRETADGQTRMYRGGCVGHEGLEILQRPERGLDGNNKRGHDTNVAAGERAPERHAFREWQCFHRDRERMVHAILSGLEECCG